MDTPQINELQKDQLLARIFYSMSQDQRRMLMRELPEAYNAYCGERIVAVVRVSEMPRGVQVL